MKRLFEKRKKLGVSEFQALLDWRNTPTEGMAISPVQRLMGRRCRTVLSTSESLLRPSYSLRDDVRAISDKKRDDIEAIYAFATLSNVLIHLRLTCVTFRVGQLITFSVKLYYIYGGVSYYS